MQRIKISCGRELLFVEDNLEGEILDGESLA